MKILFCSGAGERPHSSNDGLFYALKQVGCEVLWCGPGYEGRDCADIKIEDRPHPEYYSYEEVLDKCPWTPDVILAVEPHFFLCGKKPNNIKSGYYVLDPHRGASTAIEVIKNGSYDTAFISQRYHIPLFEFDHRIKYRKKVEFVYLPQAFDPRCFPIQENSSSYRCDIAFVGQTGIKDMEYPYEDDIGRYATHTPSNLPTNHERFLFADNQSYDYATRAEMLIRLSKNFSVRMYTGLTGSNVQQAIQTGVIGFHQSLLHDLALRPFEVMASGRPVIMDAVPDAISLFRHNKNCVMYNNYFNPLFGNFDVEYQQVRKLVSSALEDDTMSTVSANEARHYTHATHSWLNRATRIREHFSLV